METFIDGHKLEIQDTGAPRGERNMWEVFLNGQQVYNGFNGAEARRIHAGIEAGLRDGELNKQRARK